MGEVFFYHLTRRSLEAVLPDLLERTLARGWRAVVRSPLPERIATLDTLLWTHAEESFLPHGTAAMPHAARQPLYLATGPEMPNAPDVLFLLDGAEGGEAELRTLSRAVLLFDGRDEAAVAAARADWRRVAALGLPAIYWAEEEGRFVKKAEARAP